MNRALLVQLWIFVIGFLFTNLQKSSFDPVFRVLVALPIGWAVFGICATAVYGVYFAPSSQMVLLVVLGLTTFGVFVANVRHGALSKRALLFGAASLAILTGVGIIVDALRIVTMSPDSSYIVRFGQNIGLGNYQASRMIFSMWGPLVPSIHSITNLLDQKLYWQYQPILSLNLVAIVFYTTYTTIRKYKPVLPSLLGAVVLVGTMALSPLFLFHFFYIHVNIISALYMYLFVFALLKVEQPPGHAYVLLALLSLIAFSLTRLEAPVFAVVILLVATFRQGWSYTARLKLILPFVVFFISWYARVYFILPASPDLLSKPLVIAFILLLFGFGLFATASNWKSLGLVFEKTSFLTLIGLSVVSVGLTLLKPAHMLGSLNSMGRNIFLDGNWGLTWYVILFLAIESFFARVHIATERGWLFMVLASYLLVVYSLAYFSDPYHVGSFDSANRLVLQALPLVCLCLSTSIGAVWQTQEAQGAKDHAVKATAAPISGHRIERA